MSLCTYYVSGKKTSQEVNTFGIFFLKKLQITKTIIGFKKEKLVDKIPQKYLTIEKKYTNTFMNITITSGISILRDFFLLFSVGVTRCKSVIVQKLEIKIPQKSVYDCKLQQKRI